MLTVKKNGNNQNKFRLAPVQHLVQQRNNSATFVDYES